MTTNPLDENVFSFGDSVVIYQIERASGRCGLQIVPASRIDRRVAKREILDGPEITVLPESWKPARAHFMDSMVQLHVRGLQPPFGYAQGRTMRNGVAAESLRYVSQSRAGDSIVTVLDSPHGFRCMHRLQWLPESSCFRLSSVFTNTSDTPLWLEMLSSFSLGGVTPFDPADASGRLKLHRFRSKWSAEGRHEVRFAEEFQLERPWLGNAASCERFGQVGSLPVRGWFPVAAVEDAGAGVVWAAQLAIPGSWQMEFYRRDDHISFSGGLADLEFGHWSKRIQPGESFESPSACVTVVQGGIESACQRLVRSHLYDVPAVEEDLPVVFNEWCTTWGYPTHDTTVAIAAEAAALGARYLVIDAGWFRDGSVKKPSGEQGDWTCEQGDWIVNPLHFPGGLAETCAAIRQQGLIPGLWFEFEVCGVNATAFHCTDHLLQRDGIPLQVGPRRFWDFRDPWVHDYLWERMVEVLRSNGFGYLKVDYNETIGLGCDGSDSPGEGLRQHLDGVRAFFEKIRRGLPDLVIEMCASGGNRLEPSLLDFASMGSFSDAHESREIPIIAANVQRLIPPAKNQIWAVLRPDDTPQRQIYSLTATFLGRMCLSGDVQELSVSQKEIVKEAVRIYRLAAPTIKEGVSRREGPEHLSYGHPAGYQAVIRISSDGRRALVVVHRFHAPDLDQITLTLPEGDWEVEEILSATPECITVSGNHLGVGFTGDFSGHAILLRGISLDDKS